MDRDRAIVAQHVLEAAPDFIASPVGRGGADAVDVERELMAFDEAGECEPSRPIKREATSVSGGVAGAGRVTGQSRR
jgi:hypothetical protein